MAKNKIISAIDIGSSKITAVISQIRDEDQLRLHIIGAATSPSKGVRKGQIVNIEESVSAITEAVEAAERMAGYNMSKVFVSVNGSHITSQNSHGVVAVSQPQGEIIAEDVRRVLEAARAISLPSASEVVHIIPKNFMVDSQEGVKDPVGMTGVRLEVDTHMIIGSSPVIRNLAKCVTEVGCDVAGLVYCGLASSHAVLSDTERELGVVLVDVGGGTMSMAIFVEGALAYSSVLQVGAINITKDLAAGLRISLESAEKIKLHLSTLKDKEDDIDLESLHLIEDLKSVSHKTIVEGIIRPRINEMFQLVATEIKKSNLAGLTPSGVVITGGGALTVGMVDSAKRMLAMPVRLGKPVGISGLIEDVESPAFAAAVGLLKYAHNSSEVDTSNSSPQLPSLDKFPIKNVFGKIVQLAKSLLP